MAVSIDLMSCLEVWRDKRFRPLSLRYAS
ncbi:uncharacterized protein METZ01_LOCUS144522, partial [marine metagenome]